MDPRDCSVIDRHFARLQQCLEPSKLFRHLETAGVIDEDDVETIREEKKKTSRENQVAVFVDIIKRRENGLGHLLQALLKSKVQDFLARELLEDDVYDEEGKRMILTQTTCFDTQHCVTRVQFPQLQLCQFDFFIRQFRENFTSFFP